jgi:polyphosphate kinase
LVAPQGLRSGLLALIAREAAHARAGRPARIIAKMNAVVDHEVIDALYDASQAGVTIDLIIRGICCLRPGMPGLSERIRVISLIGRFLEHSRIWMFENGGVAEFFIGSADWMPRNLDRRVEVVAPVQAESHRRQLRGVLDRCLADHRAAWDLTPESEYVQRRAEGIEERAVHQHLMRSPWG